MGSITHISYADAGHNNMNRTDFQNYAAQMNDGVVPDGADIGLVAKQAGLNANVVNHKSYEIIQFGTNMQYGKMEGILTVGIDKNFGHTVNIVSFDVLEKLNILGGGTHFYMDNIIVWDPLGGSTRRLTEKILKFIFIKY